VPVASPERGLDVCREVDARTALRAYSRDVESSDTTVLTEKLAVTGWSPRRRLILDIGLSVVLTANAVAAGGWSDEYPNPGPVTGVLMGVAGAALVFRRLAPTPAFVVSFGCMAATSLLFGSYQAGSSLLIAIVAMYSAVAYRVALPVVLGVGLLLVIAESVGSGWPGAIGSALFVGLVLVLAGGGGFLARRLRELSAANAALRELVQLESAATTQAAISAERARIARELHDILSHSLAVVALQTGAAEHAWGHDDERALESVRAARATSLEAIEQLRALLTAVNDDPSGERVPLPTLEDLPVLAARSTDAGFRVDYDVIGDPRPVPLQVQASVYRVTQEGISNALKHSSSPGCRIRLLYDVDVVSVLVDDAGGSVTSSSGSQLGLAGIRERAAVFGGHVEAGPRSDGGWRLHVAFPS
jgi:signal transduction histidine kinase